LPTTLDSEVLRDLYGSAEVRAVFESRSLVQSWLDVERALAEAEAEAGVIPSASAERIAHEADAAFYDLDALRDGIADSQHPLVPLLRALTERCGEHGGWVHWGATTQDVIDTGLVLQVRSGLAPITRDLDRATTAAERLADEFAEAPVAGRTHGQHAVPITFGFKAASWTDELRRAGARTAAAAEGISVAQLGGAAGTLASLGEAAAPVRSAFARALGLAEAEIAWHVARDRFRDLAHALDEVGAVAERIATEVVRLQATEIAEVLEPAADGHVGSSTMPQKRNPMVSEYIAASARLLRGSTAALRSHPAHAHERDMAAWAVEWIAIPQALILAGGLTAKLADLLEGLVVDPVRMLTNLGLTRDHVMAEAAMMALARAVGHSDAHAIVAAAARRANAEARGLGEVLAEDPAVAGHLTADEIAELLSPSAYVDAAALAVERVLRSSGSRAVGPA
jgi:3-carboxy-cis,cis-muconate cycloisomerase